MAQKNTGFGIRRDSRSGVASEALRVSRPPPGKWVWVQYLKFYYDVRVGPGTQWTVQNSSHQCVSLLSASHPITFSVPVSHLPSPLGFSSRSHSVMVISGEHRLSEP